MAARNPRTWEGVARMEARAAMGAVRSHRSGAARSCPPLEKTRIIAVLLRAASTCPRCLSVHLPSVPHGPLLRRVRIGACSRPLPPHPLPCPLTPRKQRKRACSNSST